MDYKRSKYGMKSDREVKAVPAVRSRRAQLVRGRAAAVEAPEVAVGNPQPLKLPHERDLLPEAPRDPPAPQMRRAYRDLLHGLVDTDRGAEAGRTYKRLKP